MKHTLQFLYVLALITCGFFPKINAQNAIHEIKGTVVLDANANCIFDAGDTSLENWFLRVKSGTGSFTVETDASGFYQFFVANGSYEVALVPLNNNFSVCGNNAQSVSYNSSTPQSASFDFVAEAAFSCPKLRTEISASNVVPCSTAMVDVFYKNDGTTVANNAHISIHLDENLEFQSSSPASTDITDNIVLYDLGNIGAKPGGAWDKIEIQAAVQCLIPVGTTLGIHAQATPNETCSTNTNWSGAVIVASGMCDYGNVAICSLKNIGNAPSSLLEYIIVEDQIVLRQDVFKLNPGEVFTDTATTAGQAVSIIAQQEPNFPGDSLVSYTVYNCNGTAQSTTNFPATSGPFSHQEGIVVRASTESTEKSAKPKGFGQQNILRIGTPIEYRIPFENVTNGFVQTVVIRDTLDANLDADKMELRGSSHACDFAKIAGNVVQFTFSNINLPPAASNPNQSSGYVEFMIYPKPNLVQGTIVENTATVYFDQSMSVQTNSVQRQYEDELFVKVIDLEGFIDFKIKTYPNPFISEVNFELPESALGNAYQLKLMDVLGRVVYGTGFIGKTCTVKRKDLPSGLLIWQIESNGKIVKTGKIISMN